jgi:hypothetical protein
MIFEDNEYYEEVPPDASSIIESHRAHGYNLPTAIADIIDNSIAAKCRNVWVQFEWDEKDPWISITDDGTGMTEPELTKAMRLGSQSPLVLRDPKDLGRFGLGLKTASFSQARRLTVRSLAEEGSQCVRRWDLDHLARPDVSGWQLLKTIHPDTGRRSDEINRRELRSGTVVLLEVLDRVIADDLLEMGEVSKNHWVSEVARVRQHLAMVFHRFLADPPKSRIRIWLNDTEVVPWDPFCEAHPSTQLEAEDVSKDLGSAVAAKGFILPHRDRFDLDDKERSMKLHQGAAGPGGWNAQQGFYLYRNRRLIIPGDWLGLGPGQNGWKKEEHFKLARIRVDIPNSMDHAWQIDVKKSTAIAPPPLRSWLTGLAKTVREKARDVYAYRGGRSVRRRATGQVPARPWITKTKPDGTFSYQIDRRHPLFKAILSEIPMDCRDLTETFLRLVEETVPVQRIWIDAADNQEGFADPFEGESHAKIKRHLELCHRVLVESGQSTDEAWDELAVFPAFQTRYAQALIGLLQE